jgi:hypothetical protein
MRDYGKVFSAIWESATFRDLSEDGRTLVMYLLTCTHGTLAGVFRLPDGYVCEDVQWGSERVSKGFLELSEKGFATRDPSSKWVWVIKHFEWNSLENPNQCKAAAKIVSKVPDECCWKRDYMRVCGHLMGLEPLAERNPSSTVPQPSQNQYQELELYQKQEQEQKLKQEEPTSGGLKFPKPAATRSARAPKAQADVTPIGTGTWNAYSTAYADRYGAPPVRNAKVNAQIAQLVQRLGADEAPRVAAFYVLHNSRTYVQATHTVDLLLRDAEGLRTQWAQGRQTTQTEATLADRTQANAGAFGPLIAEARAREAKEAV